MWYSALFVHKLIAFCKLARGLKSVPALSSLAAKAPGRFPLPYREPPVPRTYKILSPVPDIS